MAQPYTLDSSRIVQVGETFVSTGNPIPFRGSYYGEVITQELHGKHAELVRRGHVFSAKIAGSQAQAIPSYATLTNAFVLYNLSNTNMLITPLFLNITPAAGWATLTAAVDFNVGLITSTSEGAAVTAGWTGTVGTALTATNTLLGSAKGAQGKAYATTGFAASTTAVIAWDLGTALFCPTSGTLTTGLIQWNFNYDFHGLISMKPGSAIAIVTANTLTGGTASATFNQTIFWSEEPLSVEMT
jgi:hypothetical protein